MPTVKILTANQVHQVSRASLRQISGAVPGSGIVGCDAYEPGPVGFNPCSAKPISFAYALYRTKVTAVGVTEETYALVGLCRGHTSAGHLRVRRYPALPMVRPAILSAWLAITGAGNE